MAQPMQDRNGEGNAGRLLTTMSKAHDPYFICFLGQRQALSKTTKTQPPINNEIVPPIHNETIHPSEHESMPSVAIFRSAATFY